MNNPWYLLRQEPPFCLPDEVELFEYYNSTKGKKNPENRIEFNVLPEPFIGDLDNCEVVFLMTNPGSDDRDPKFHQDLKQMMINNLIQVDMGEYPLYSFNPEHRNSGGGDYWIKRCREIIEVVGLKNIAQKLVFLEYFPYHSIKFNDPGPRMINKFLMKKNLDGQLFNFHLLKQFIESDLLIIGARSLSYWEKGMRNTFGISTNKLMVKIKRPNLNYRSPFFNRNQLGDTFNLITEKLS